MTRMQVKIGLIASTITILASIAAYVLPPGYVG